MSEASEALEVTGLAYGPHAIARRGGKVMFIRGAVPGDTVTIAVREERRAYAYAEVTAVLHPSPDRRDPPCPYLPRCGGCPWQHIAYDAQLRAKAAIVRDHLTRAIDTQDIEWDGIIPADEEFHYRHRLSLRVANGQVGFFAGGSHELVPVERCVLGEPALDDAIPVAQQWIGRLRSGVGRLEILLAADGARWVLAAEAEGTLASHDDRVSAEFLAAQVRVAGLVLRGRRMRRVWGDDRCRLEIEPELGWSVRAGTFSQVTRSGNRVLVRAVMGAGAFTNGQRVLDVYAGAGNLSLPIARRVATVVAIEQSALAVEDGVANARALGLSNCEFRRQSAVEGIAAAASARECYDTIVLDPPRSGAADAMPAIVRLAPTRIVYVSCDPTTLARDLRRLVPHYRVIRVQPIDLFPQTYHVETVVTAIRAAGRAGG